MYASGTMLESPIKVACSNTSVSGVKGTIVKLTVCAVKMGKEWMHEQWRVEVHNPKYQRGFIWNVDVEVSTPSVSSTLYHKLLPDVPIDNYNYSLVTDTIIRNADLFEIVTLIHVSVLEELSTSHLNCVFVTSIL